MKLRQWHSQMKGKEFTVTKRALQEISTFFMLKEFYLVLRNKQKYEIHISVNSNDVRLL